MKMLVLWYLTKKEPNKLQCYGAYRAEDMTPQAHAAWAMLKGDKKFICGLFEEIEMVPGQPCFVTLKEQFSHQPPEVLELNPKAKATINKELSW